MLTLTDTLDASSINHDARPAVLAVDDEPGIRRIMGRLLQEIGMRPLLAASEPEARQLFKANGPDIRLVLLDWRLGEHSADQLLSDFLDQTPGLRVVLVTGSPDAIINPTATHDTVSILLKPFTPSQFMLVVKSVLGA